MRINKDDIYAFLGSLAFHLVFLFVLWYSVLRTEIPEDQGGVLVNFGNVDAAAGTFEPRYTGQQPPQESTSVPPPPEPVNPAEDDLLTQDLEESVALEDEKKKEEDRKRKEDELRRLEEEREKKRQQELEAERRRKAEEQRKQAQAIKDKVAGAFGIGSAEGNSQGSAAEGTGNQGSPFGNSDHGKDDGVGGMGTFDLNGRSSGAGGLPTPVYTSQLEGKIVIDITVSPKGDVIYADIGRGTNIENASMRRSALQAAKKAKFNSISGTNNQSGTITYVYKLR